jgi:hypothetical protein
MTLLMKCAGRSTLTASTALVATLYLSTATPAGAQSAVAHDLR